MTDSTTGSITESTLRIFALSHRGTVRPTNQDSLAIGPFVAAGTQVGGLAITVDHRERIACAVLDGMGGHAHGEIASRLGARHVASHALDSDEPLEAVATKLLRDVNALLYDAMATDATLRGTGATIAGVLIENEQLLAFNLGDSRVYRWQDGFLFQLSVDDALREDEMRGRLTQSLGGAPSFTQIEPHLVRETWLPGRRYLVCSDGLFDALSIDTMERALAGPPERALAQLQEDALAAYANDNFSALWLVCE